MGFLHTLGNVAAYGAVPVTGGLSLLGKKKVRGAVGNIPNAVSNGYENVSGANAAKSATATQVGGLEQAGAAEDLGYQQADSRLAAYDNPNDMSTFRSKLSGGQFDPQYQTYSGPADAGPGAMPTYDEYSGPTGFQASAPPPTRQAATAENVNMYQDPGYQYRLSEGLRAVQGSAAARGMLRSSAAQNNVQSTAQNLASQEYGNAYDRFQGAQNTAQNDYWDRTNADQKNFVDQRTFANGLVNTRNDNRADLADRTQKNFVDQRTFSAGQLKDQNAQAADTATNAYSRWNDLAGISRDTAISRANLGAKRAGTRAQYLQDIANVRAGGTLARSNANRALVGDAVEAGTSIYKAGK